MPLDPQKKGLILVFITALVSGISIFVNSIGVKEFNSSLFAFLKNGVVALFLFSFIMILGKVGEIKNLNKKQWLNLVLIGFIGGSIPFLLFFKGLQMTTGTTASFVHKTLFIFVGAFALVFLKERINKGFVLGAALIMGGTYFMIRPSFVFSFGHLLILFAVLFWAAENTLAKYVTRNVSGSVVAFGRMFFGSLFILAYLSFSGEISLIGQISSTQILWIALTSCFLFLYVLTFYNGIRYIKVSSAASVLSLGAPITAVLSFVFSGKAISAYQLTGIFLIVLGVVSVVYFAHIYSFLINKAVRIKQYGRV